jgi:hypothetical protein
VDPLLRLYLVVFPLAYIAVVPVAGARVTVADLLLVVLGAGWTIGAVVAALSGDRDPRGAPSRRRLIPAELALPIGALLAYAAWVALSGWWGHHPAYAAVKGGGAAALTVLVVVIARQGRPRLSAVADAWLAGAAVAVVVIGGCLVLGPGTRGLVLYRGGASVLGLPRVSGTFHHPNLFGEWVLASGLLLWARWPAWRTSGSPVWRRHGAVPLAAALGVLLAFTASTAWAGAGLAVLLLPLRGMAPVRRRLLRVAGLLLLVGTLVGAVVPLEVGASGAVLTTSGVRPAVWESAADAVTEAPIVGVGAAPYLARAVDPLRPEAGPLLWDAHSLPLSLVGQFGVVGLALFTIGVGGIVRRLRHHDRSERGDGPRLRRALVVVAAAAGLHSLMAATEEMRHLWILLGMAAGWGVWRRGMAAPEAAPGVEAVVEALDQVEWDES